MASAHIYTLANSADVALAAATAKTVLQLATPSTRKAWVKEASIGFKSVTSTDVPVLVQLKRQSTTGTGTSLTANPDVEGHPASLCTGCKENYTVEPTTGVTVKEWYVTPIGGLLVYQLPLGDEIEMIVSGFLGLVVTAAATQNCRAYLKFNE